MPERNLRKLPTLSLENIENDDAALANGAEEDDDDDVDMEDAGTEEEAAAAARAAAEKREERLQVESLARQVGEDGVDAINHTVEVNGDVIMAEAVEVLSESVPVVEEDEVDLLDAFMDEMGDPFAAPKADNDFSKSKGKPEQQEPEPIFGDEH